MYFNQPVKNLIEKRNSCRSYTKESISEADRASLQAFLSEEATGPFGSDSRFELIAAAEGDTSALKDLGTYGLLKNPTAYILGAVSESKMNLEDFGYIMENIILKATDLGLGTCWLGGTFSRSTFADRLNLKESEIMPAVTAAGNIAPRRTIRDGISRKVAKSDHRRPWENIFFDQTPGEALTRDAAGAYGEILELVRLAPSASNKQPWRFIKDGKNFHFYLKRDEKYANQLKTFKAEDLQRVDIGIAICHFELSAREAGFKGEWIDAAPAITFDETKYIITWQGK